MHKIYNEQLVKRSPSKKARVTQVSIAVAAVILIALLGFIPDLLSLIPVLLVAIIIGAVVLIRRQNVEFEYALHDNFLEVDKILAKSTRKGIASIEASAVEAFGKEERDMQELKNTYQTVQDCAGDVGDVYSIVYMGVGDEGRCILLFTPNEKMLDALRRVISPRVWKNDD